MKQEKSDSKIGLVLTQPQLIYQDTSIKVKFIYYYLLLLLGMLSAYACFYTAFSIPVYFEELILSILIFTGVITVIFLIKPHHVVLLFIISLCLLTMIALETGFMDFIKTNLADGAVSVINSVISTYSDKLHYDLLYIIAFTPVEEIDNIVLSNTLFEGTVLFLTTFLIGYFLIIKQNILMCFLLTVPYPIFSLAVYIYPHYVAIASLLIFWILLLFMVNGLQPKKQWNIKKRKFYGHTRNLDTPSSFIWIPFLILFMIFIYFLFPQNTYQRLNLVEDLRIQLLSGSNNTTIYGNYGESTNLNRVNLQGTGDISYTGETVLRVKTTKQEVDYLKSFVGSIYTGQSWEVLDEEEDEQLIQILDEDKVQNFQYLLSDIFPSDLDSDKYEYDMIIQNVGGNQRNIYVPYGLASTPDMLSGVDFINDAFLKFNSIFSQKKEYQLEAVSLSLGQPYASFYHRVMSMLSEDVGFETNLQAIDSWTMSEEIKNNLSLEQIAFGEKVQEYTQFVYSHYTQLPDDLKEELTNYLQENNLNEDEYPGTYLLSQAIIQQVFSENEYTLSPGVTPQGKDFVSYFLLENHKGYCVHFASAAVVLLRAAGIPARYAQGFSISPLDTRNEEGWIDIPDNRAHAWAEIYLSGIGWIPLEATPGSVEGIVNWQEEEEDTQALDQEENEEISPDEQEEVERPEINPETNENDLDSNNDIDSNNDATTLITNNEEMSDNGKDSQNLVLAVITKIIIVLIAIASIISGFWINRRLRLFFRNKKFSQEDNNNNAIAVYDYIRRIQKRMKLSEEESEIPKELNNIILRARFSQHQLTEDEVKILFKYMEEQIEEIRIKMPRYKYFFYKYILGLI